MPENNLLNKENWRCRILYILKEKHVQFVVFDAKRICFIATVAINCYNKLSSFPRSAQHQHSDPDTSWWFGS